MIIKFLQQIKIQWKSTVGSRTIKYLYDGYYRGNTEILLQQKIMNSYTSYILVSIYWKLL